jgi:hypothetical protein
LTADRVAIIDWDDSRVDVPDLDLVLPQNASGLDDVTHKAAAQAWAAWDAALMYTGGWCEEAEERLAEVRAS